LALENYIVGNLRIFGVNREQITFQAMPKFKGRFPAVSYYTNALREGISAEGISCLIRGKHYKIGVMYEQQCRSMAKKNLAQFLNSFKVD